MGAAARAFLPPLRDHAEFELVAFAEPVAETRETVTAETGAAGFADLPSMLGQASIDAVYIATPTELHAGHANLVFAAGKHVLTEKPMAIRLEDAQAMVAAAERAGVKLVVGHAHGFDRPIQAIREIVTSGRLGRVRMIHTWNFTDWMYRPRRPDELEIALGGGVTFRQGSHQFDIIRLLGGGLVKSIRASTFDWDPNRRSIGAHTVFMQFADGITATAVYNGYGYFSTMELISDVAEWGFTEPVEKRPPVKRTFGDTSAADELEAKRRRAKDAIPTSAPHQPHFGLTVVSCERGDIRQSPDGLYIYSERGREEIAVPNDKSPRDLVLDEFAAAIAGRAQPVHDGRWGLANLELCLAAIESSKRGEEIQLKHQVSA
ncbi:oxidoreductase domain-containing protein [Rhodoplanes sp. Z2-YC6860]|nr:oxidoreductase domain-containing protein [Rhodoplanes sp. Z2-YC6860]